MKSPARVSSVPRRFTVRLIGQFFVYSAVGAVATAVDWGMFRAATKLASLDYRAAVCFSLCLGAITNFSLNRAVTFKDHKRRVELQLGVFLTVFLLSLLGTVCLMHLFVETAKLSEMVARIVTTGLMLLVNFLLHKYITFNKALYERAAAKQQPLQ